MGRTLFTPIVRRLHGLGVSPNLLTAVSLVFAAGAGVAFYLSSPAEGGLLLVASVLVTLNASFDGMDGILARMTGQDDARGDYLDHVVDRYADIAILTGLALSGWTTPVVGLFAIVGTLLTSYMGTQAQAVGIGREYGGLLGRADRLGMMAVVPLLQLLMLDQGWALPWETNLLELLLAYIAIVGNVTAIQRFAQGWRDLGERDGDA